jgi:carbon starvation protein
MNAMVLLVTALAVFVLAYRFYYSFIAAKVAVINDRMTTPARRLYDGQNYYPMNKWVLFGHHFAVRLSVRFWRRNSDIFPVFSGW